MSGKKYSTRSIAWQHFQERDVNKDEVICDYCGEKLKRGGGTSNMFKHLERKHPTRLPEKRFRTNVRRSRSSSPNQGHQEQDVDDPDMPQAGPSSRPSEPIHRSRPVQHTLESVLKRDRSLTPMPGELDFVV